jgi:hypothetical protein
MRMVLSRLLPPAQRPSAWPMPDGTQSATMARPAAERSSSRGKRIHNAERPSALGVPSRWRP